MRHFITTILITFLFFGVSFSQLGDMDLTDFGSISDLKSEIEPFNDAFHSGLNVLTFTSADAPSIFGINVSVFMGFSSIEKNPDIGLNEKGFTFSTMGIQAGFGTAGIEIFARYFPEFETSGYNIDALGFGLKYDLSDMIPVTGFPSTSLYAEYNRQSFGVNDNRNVTVDNGAGGTINGRVKSGIDLSFSTINIGTIVGYDLLILGIYGKLGVEIGSTELTWNQAVESAGQVISAEQNGDLDTTAMRYAVGLTLFGFRAEIGGRGSNTSAGIGYGISF